MCTTDFLVIERSDHFRREQGRYEAGRLVALLVILGFAGLFLQVQTTNPVASAAPGTAIVAMPQGAGDDPVTPDSIELRWMVGCDLLSGGYVLGVYDPDSADCAPSGRLSATRLQTALIARGVLAWNEYLEPLGDLGNADCVAEIRAVADSVVVGHLCQTGATLHRLVTVGMVQGTSVDLLITH
jgi:hypothetical protein